MEIRISKPKIDNTWRGHLSNAKKLFKELEILFDLICKRVEEHLIVFNDMRTHGIPMPDFYYQNKAGEQRDPILSLHTKAFAFVSKQFTDEIISTARKGKLKYKKGRHSNFELPTDFQSFVSILCNDSIELISPALLTIRENRDALILTRLMRNAVKKTCFMDCYFFKWRAYFLCLFARRG